MPSTGLISSLMIPVRDIGIIANECKHSQLRNGLLFVSPSLQNADSNDNRLMRDELGIRTVMDSAPQTLYRNDLKNAGKHVAQVIVTDKILGLTSCHVNLRSTQWTEDLLSGLTTWSRMKLNFQVAFTEDQSQIVQTEPVKRLIAQRARLSRVEKNLLLLEASSKTIGQLFNDVVLNAAFPLVICGHSSNTNKTWNIDHTLILFTLLLVLEVPVDAIEHIDSHIMEDVLHDSKGQTEAIQGFANDAANDKQWASELVQRLSTKHGNIDGFLAAAGITQKTRSGLKDILLLDRVVGEKDLINLS